MVTIKPLTSKNNDFNLDLTAEEVELYKALQGRWNRKVEIKETHETEKVLMHDAAVKKAMLVTSSTRPVFEQRSIEPRPQPKPAVVKPAAAAVNKSLSSSTEMPVNDDETEPNWADVEYAQPSSGTIRKKAAAVNDDSDEENDSDIFYVFPREGTILTKKWDVQNKRYPLTVKLPNVSLPGLKKSTAMDVVEEAESFDHSKPEQHNNTLCFKITMPADSIGWAFNICPGNDEYCTDTRVHFNPRYRDPKKDPKKRYRQKVTMTNKRGTWGDALEVPMDRFNDGDGLRSQEMIVTVQINLQGYLIFVSDVFTAFFPHRTPVESLVAAEELKIVFLTQDANGNRYLYTVHQVWWGHQPDLHQEKLKDGHREQIEAVLETNNKLDTTVVPMEPRTIYIEGIPITDNLKTLQAIEYLFSDVLERIELTAAITLVPGSDFGYVRLQTIEQAAVALPELNDVQFDDDELGMSLSFKADWAELYIGREAARRVEVMQLQQSSQEDYTYQDQQRQDSNAMEEAV